MNYFWRVLLAIDQMANVFFSPVLNWVLKPKHLFGDEDETLSSVFGKNVRNGSCRACHVMCLILHFIDTNHCKKSIEEDEGL